MKKRKAKRGRPEKSKTKVAKKIPKKFLVRGLVSDKGGTDCFGVW